MTNKECEQYHDEVWGVEVHHDEMLFEMLSLELNQSGLSWATILKKRENFRRAFENFDIDKVANYDEKKVEELLEDKGIIRHRLKIVAVIENAKAIQKIQEEFGSFDQYIWQFVNGKPIINQWKSEKEIPSFTDLSLLICNDLKKRQFKFVGKTTVYSFMQAIGLVNDHVVDCFRYREVFLEK